MRTTFKAWLISLAALAILNIIMVTSLLDRGLIQKGIEFAESGGLFLIVALSVWGLIEMILKVVEPDA